MKNIRSIVGATVLVLLAVSLLVIVLNVSLERSIEVECQELYKLSTQYENFFYSENQAVMCNIK
jgi:hypothetical protein